jgi:hypothetical protein
MESSSGSSSAGPHAAAIEIRESEPLTISNTQSLDMRYGRVGDALSDWALRTPDATFLAERDGGDGWEK